MRQLLIILILTAGMAGAAHAEEGGPGNTRHVAIALGGILVIAGLVWALTRRRNDHGGYYGHDEGEDRNGVPTYAPGHDTVDPNTRPRKEPSLKPDSAALGTRPRTDTIIAPWVVPADFDVSRFLRKSKAYFMRLQASWDKGDVRDIRQFTTRDVFGEFCIQLNQRGSAPNATEVVTLGAELLGVETAGENYLATVKFTGMIKDGQDAQAMPFSEVWNMIKPTNGTRSWAITCIQQY